MKEIINRLKENFTDDQIREIAFAFNPDSENIEDYFDKLEDEVGQKDSELYTLKENWKLFEKDIDRIFCKSGLDSSKVIDRFMDLLETYHYLMK